MKVVFDRMNHYALLLKLMDRRLPNQLLTIFELWFSGGLFPLLALNGMVMLFSFYRAACNADAV